LQYAIVWQGMSQELINNICHSLTEVICETNGLALQDTLMLMSSDHRLAQDVSEKIKSFSALLNNYKIGDGDIEDLITHPVGQALTQFFKNFPLRFREEHIHLTGSLDADFIWPRLDILLKGPQRKVYQDKLASVYGEQARDIQSVEQVEKMIRLGKGERFDRYLEILLAPKLFLTNRAAHQEAAYHLAESLWSKYNIGAIRLKFTLNRATTKQSEQIPGIEKVTSEDSVLGLYEGFREFQKRHPGFEFILSPCFRKEPEFFDAQKFSSKKESFASQVALLLKILKDHPFLRDHIVEVDTVGSEKLLFRKSHFMEMKVGFRKLQARGIKIRSHHGETWDTLKKGIQSVDNAMNIWHVDAIEHGLSLGINPNFYYHGLFLKIARRNRDGEKLDKDSLAYRELVAMDWEKNKSILDKLIGGIPLSEKEKIIFTKTKYHTSIEVSHYQHDIINRMLDKNLSVIALPSSNKKLTGQFEDYKDHPFSWWEKKGLKLGVGTDNYITLGTNYLREMLILLLSDPEGLKITKLLLVCTGQVDRPFLSHQLWRMKNSLNKRESSLKND